MLSRCAALRELYLPSCRAFADADLRLILQECSSLSVLDLSQVRRRTPASPRPAAPRPWEGARRLLTTTTTNRVAQTRFCSLDMISQFCKPGVLQYLRLPNARMFTFGGSFCPRAFGQWQRALGRLQQAHPTCVIDIIDIITWEGFHYGNTLSLD